MTKRIINIINDHYGSKKGLCRYIKYQVLYITGRYTAALNIDFTRVHRFVFVCSGNICRSPLGEYVMKKLGGNAISFGLDTRGGDKADPRMIAFGTYRKYEINNHTTTRVNDYTPDSNDLLIGMEPLHLQKLKAMFPDHQITLLGLWLPGKKAYIHDPYCANMIYFNRCSAMVEHATENLHNYCELKDSGKKKLNAHTLTI